LAVAASGYSFPREEHTVTAEFTGVFRRVPEGYIAFVEELPGANTQGATLEEARENLQEAVQLVIEANRALAEEKLEGIDIAPNPAEILALAVASFADIPAAELRSLTQRLEEPESRAVTVSQPPSHR
jgi:predicted RNase H-like HicB family nuclease